MQISANGAGGSAFHPEPARFADGEEERRLLVRVREGDRAAFGAIVNLHLPRATSLAMRVTGNQSDAEDVVQDAFLAALNAIDGFDNRRPFWPWLSRIVVNRAIDVVNARQRNAANELDASLADTRATASGAVEGREIREHVAQCLASMPPRRRLVAEMFEVEGRSIADIAEQLGMTTTTVRWHLHTARKQLRSCLAVFRTHG